VGRADAGKAQSQPTDKESDVTDTGDRDKLVELMRDMPIAMVTTFGSEGPRSVPMARQEVEPDAEMWFITARDTDHVRAIQSEPRVALTFSSRDSWVALTGRATLVFDQPKLEELWNTFAEAWMPEGPEDPNAALLRVEVDRAEYWDTPGGKVASLLSFAKTKLTGSTYDADHGTVDL
jgi:general stress protein 26